LLLQDWLSLYWLFNLLFNFLFVNWFNGFDRLVMDLVLNYCVSNFGFTMLDWSLNRARIFLGRLLFSIVSFLGPRLVHQLLSTTITTSAATLAPITISSTAR
jgi:hypothetical protein